MGKQTISGEMIITEDLDCVELVEEGCPGLPFRIYFP